MNVINFLSSYSPIKLSIFAKEDLALKDFGEKILFSTDIINYYIIKYQDGWLSIDIDEKNDYIFCKDYDYLTAYLKGESYQRKVYFEFYTDESNKENYVININDNILINELITKFNAELLKSEDGFSYYLLEDVYVLKFFEYYESFGELFQSIDVYQMYEAYLKKNRNLVASGTLSREYKREVKCFNNFTINLAKNLDFYLDKLCYLLNLKELEYNRRGFEEVIIHCYEYSLNKNIYGELRLCLIAYLSKFYLINFPDECKLITSSQKKNSKKNDLRPIIRFKNGEEIDLILAIGIRTCNKIIENEYHPYYYGGLYPWSKVN